MYTRKQYMAEEVTKQDYYFQFVTNDIIVFVLNKMGENINEAFDVHDFPDSFWNSLSFYIRNMICDQKLIEAGEGWDANTGSNIAKATADYIFYMKNSYPN